MSIWQAVVYGIVQGLTEFLPVSSSAHLRLVPALCGWSDPGPAFTAVIQWGTLAACIWYFRFDIAHLTKAVGGDLLTNRFSGSVDSRLGWMVALGTIPIVVAGLLFQSKIKAPLRSLYVVSGALIILALFLLAAECLLTWRRRSGKPPKQVEEISWTDGLSMGFAQALALIPGVSRSGVTITCGLFLGLGREAAARFSFLLSLPAVFAAGVYELIKERKELLQSHDSILALVIATVISAIVGYASIAFLLGLLRRHGTYLFIVYRIMLGGVILILLSKGRLEP